MVKHLQPKLFLWLNTALLSFSLLLLLTSPSLAEGCKQAEIRSHIGQFKDNNLQQVARKVVVKCDTQAVVPLAEALSDRNPTIRAQAASALGTMGWTARDAVSDLVEALDDSDTLVRSKAAQSIGKIGRTAQQQARTLSELDLGAIQDLETLKKQLEQALSRLEKNNKDWTGKEQAQQELRLTRNALQTNLNYLKDKPLYQVIQWVLKNPWIGLVVAAGGYLSIFIIRPLWLLQLDKVLQSQTVKIPLVDYQLPLQKVLIFRYRHRVLDAWVQEHLDSVKQEFFAENNRTVSDRKIHIPMPVVLDGKTLIPLPDANDNDLNAELEHKQLQRAIKDKVLKEGQQGQVRLLIQGEGGAGKTSLACQIAQWGMEGKLSNHAILPVLLEQELSEQEPLLDAILGRLQDLTNAKEISSELLENLLRQKRILIIVDRLSEMGKATREKIRPDQATFPINLLVVTSRLKEELPGVTKSILEPQRIEAERVSEFLERQSSKRS